MEYLYLIRCHEFTKIGIARNMKTRLMDLQTGNPYPLELVEKFEFASALKVESALHWKFSHLRVQGEWFRLSEADIDEIRHICANFYEDGFVVGNISKSFAVEVLKSALSYCADAGIQVELHNHEGSLFMIIHGMEYADETIKPLATVGNE